MIAALARLALGNKAMLYAAGAVVLVLLSVYAWGQRGWSKFNEERADYAEYRSAQALLVAKQQEEVARSILERQAAERAASQARAAGVKETEARYATIKAELGSVSAAYHRMLAEGDQGASGGAVPAEGGAAPGPEAATCEDRLLLVRGQVASVIKAASGVTEAATEVVSDLELAEKEVKKLVAIQGL